MAENLVVTAEAVKRAAEKCPTAEAVLKLFSFGPTIYFAEAWNKFDCAVVRSA